jgi:hypothetical protein
MKRAVGPRRLPTASETNIRRQNGKTPNSSTRGSVASTEASCPPTFLFGVETVIMNQTIHSDDGQQPAAAFHFATAATSYHAHAKRVTRTPATAPPRWSSSTASCATGNRKWQKTAPARKDSCCPCSILLTCSERNRPCAKARRPCQNCDSSRGQCSNTVAAHSAVIRDANRDHHPRSTSARFCARMGRPPRPLIPLIVDPAEHTEDNNKLATTASPATQCHIRCVQRLDRTHSTSSGAFCEGDKVAMPPNGGDTSPPTKLPTGDGLVTLQCADCCAAPTQLRSTSERDPNASASIDATPLPDNRPPLAIAPSGASYLPGPSAIINPKSLPSVQPLTHQSTVSGAVEAGQPAADRGNVDGGPTQEMVALELDRSGSSAAALNARLT